MDTLTQNNKLQVLHIQLQDTLVCIDLKYINKVLPLVRLEVIPDSPIYFAGLMNLAGKSIPVIDLAMRLGLHRSEAYDLETPILLCANETNSVGLIVDKILGLADIEEESLQMRTEFKNPDSPFSAAVERKTDLSLLLNMERVLAINLAETKHDLTNWVKKS